MPLEMGKKCSVRHFLPFAKQFAKVRTGRRIRPPLVGSALALRMQEPKDIGQRRGRVTNSGQRLQRSSFSSFPVYLSETLTD